MLSHEEVDVINKYKHQPYDEVSLDIVAMNYDNLLAIEKKIRIELGSGIQTFRSKIVGKIYKLFRKDKYHPRVSELFERQRLRLEKENAKLERISKEMESLETKLANSHNRMIGALVHTQQTCKESESARKQYKSELQTLRDVIDYSSDEDEKISALVAQSKVLPLYRKQTSRWLCAMMNKKTLLKRDKMNTQIQDEHYMYNMMLVQYTQFIGNAADQFKDIESLLDLYPTALGQMTKVDKEYSHLLGMYSKYKTVWNQLKNAMFDRLKGTIGPELTDEIDYHGPGTED